MKTFTFQIEYTHIGEITIEAESLEEAHQAAQDELDQEGFDAFHVLDTHYELEGIGDEN